MTALLACKMLCDLALALLMEFQHGPTVRFHAYSEAEHGRLLQLERLGLLTFQGWAETIDKGPRARALREEGMEVAAYRLTEAGRALAMPMLAEQQRRRALRGKPWRFRCWNASAPDRSRYLDFCHRPSARIRSIGLCAYAGHLTAWCRRKIRRLRSWPHPRGPVPSCRYCERAAVYAKLGDGGYEAWIRNDLRTATYLCDSPVCADGRSRMQDRWTTPTWSLAPLSRVQKHILSAEDALLRGDWREAALEDRQATFWRVALGVARICDAFAAKRAAATKAKAKPRKPRK